MLRLIAALTALCSLVACEKAAPVGTPQRMMVAPKSAMKEAKPPAVKAEGKMGKCAACENAASPSPNVGAALMGHGSGGGGLSTLGSGSAAGLGIGSGQAGIAGGGVVVRRLGARGKFAGDQSSSGESYGEYGVNGWVETAKDSLSTFAADVDTASYTLARAKLLQGQLPPESSVRVEEWLNYFRYHYPQPAEGPLGVTMDAAPSPFSPGKHLLRVGVQGKVLTVQERKPAHLVFLVDVSGSMQSPEKLPLAKRALRMLVDALHDGDTVALVTYAGGVRRVLEPTGMERKAEIHEAIESLQSGGGTGMASGIELAYAEAAKTLDSKSVSRVIILSDGDANIGPRDSTSLLSLIAGKVKEGVYVTTVGFGMGNLKDDLMEQFANKGNGNHYYCDSLFQAHRIFVEQLGSTLEVIAQDVKLQVEFDPAQVQSYRLVGYENRDIADADFRNDKVDAGEIGAGHSVTALYELTLKPGAGEGLATMRLRAKKPRGVEAWEKTFPFHLSSMARKFDEAPADLRFASAVMGAAEIFRQSPHAKGWNYALVQEIAASATPRGDAEREEFVRLLGRGVSVANTLATR